MADTKVSDLTAATTLSGSDVLYLVQGSNSRKITAATLFANTSNVTVKDKFNYDSSVQTMSTPGAVDLNKQITHLASDISGGVLTIPRGTPGQLKFLLMTATTGGSYTVRGNIANNANIVFSAVGNTSQLLFSSNSWFVVGGTARLT